MCLLLFFLTAIACNILKFTIFFTHFLFYPTISIVFHSFYFSIFNSNPFSFNLLFPLVFSIYLIVNVLCLVTYLHCAVSHIIFIVPFIFLFLIIFLILQPLFYLALFSSPMLIFTFHNIHFFFILLFSCFYPFFLFL